MNKLPFGDPDGSKANFDELITEFVQLDIREFSSGISSTDGDRSIRVVVGKKGSGKTVYLRRLQDSAKREESVFASKISSDIPNTNLVIYFCQLFDKDKVTEAWQSAWRIALLRSAISHVLNKRFFENEKGRQILIEKLEQYKEFVSTSSVERSPYSEIKHLLGQFRNAELFWTFAQRAEWDDIQVILGSALKHCPPIFLYLDAVDDEFAHAPLDWHRCQKGLFYTVMRFIRREGAISSRLHVVIAMRDIVYSSILQSEHRSRYLNTPHICLLDWDYDAIKFFFERKIEQKWKELKLSIKDSNQDPIENFVGLAEIQNTSRGCSENIASYLIRHTRCLPRDIVQLGNAITSGKTEWSSSKARAMDWHDQLKLIVKQNARMFADEQIQICANQLSSHDAPSHSARHRYSELYTSDQEYIRSKDTIIRSFIREIGKECFSTSDIARAVEKTSKIGEVAADIASILWQNGLIGIRRDSRSSHFEFYSMAKNAEFLLPDGCIEYAFHSILLDSIPNLTINCKFPVEERPRK